MGIFRAALDEMRKSGLNYFGPMSFQEYLRQNGIIDKRTANFISVDSLEQLDKELRDNNTMVFRLGNDNYSNETSFALLKTHNINDFFLVDELIFGSLDQVNFISKLHANELLSFNFFPNPSESTLVNLGLASGVIGEALCLDKKEYLLAPTTGKSNFTFKTKLHSSLNKLFEHKNGQVEIDCMLLGQRNGKDILFVFEAKKDSIHKSIAKHKLAYPILSIKNYIPKQIQIIPVYLKIVKNKNKICYYVSECTPIQDITIKSFSIDKILPIYNKCFVLYLD